MNDSLPAWRELLENALASHTHLPFASFVQIATVRADGRPANRTLTFRFFLCGNRLLFSADSRTEKISQLENNPWAEACWYFSESRTQFRLLGKMQTVFASDDKELIQARSRTWQERSAESRQSFTWPAAGLPLDSSPAFVHPAPDQAPETFVMLVFSPEQVERLELSCQPHAREVHRL